MPVLPLFTRASATAERAPADFARAVAAGNGEVKRTFNPALIGCHEFSTGTAQPDRRPASGRGVLRRSTLGQLHAWGGAQFAPYAPVPDSRAGIRPASSSAEHAPWPDLIFPSHFALCDHQGRMSQRSQPKPRPKPGSCGRWPCLPMRGQLRTPSVPVSWMCLGGIPDKAKIRTGPKVPVPRKKAARTG